MPEFSFTNEKPACEDDSCVCRPLSAVRRGQRVVVRHLRGEAGDCRRLREMGFHEQAEVELVCGGPAVLAQVRGSRVCLSGRMADSVLVAAVTGGH
jgi:Fe2+ transport system protein FeoA